MESTARIELRHHESTPGDANRASLWRIELQQYQTSSSDHAVGAARATGAATNREDRQLIRPPATANGPPAEASTAMNRANRPPVKLRWADREEPRMGGRLTDVQMGGRGPAAGGRTSRRGRVADLPSGFDGRVTGGDWWLQSPATPLSP
jgi:hypothetical protein